MELQVAFMLQKNEKSYILRALTIRFIYRAIQALQYYK